MHKRASYMFAEYADLKAVMSIFREALPMVVGAIFLVLFECFD